MLDVRGLRLLRELSRRGTIAAVAEALAFSPSAVSRQLGVLEREAGVVLLERTGRRVITPAGLRLVEHAEAVLERLERAAAELAGTRSGPAGPVRIGAFPSAGRSLVPRALDIPAERRPTLEPMIVEIDPAAGGDALRAGDLDAALVHGSDFVPDRPEPGVESVPLFSEAMYLVHPAGSAPVGAGTADPDGGEG
ncbi:LysR family transcriptional regulator, partial [Streptomyces alkaliphilus]